MIDMFLSNDRCMRGYKPLLWKSKYRTALLVNFLPETASCNNLKNNRSTDIRKHTRAYASGILPISYDRSIAGIYKYPGPHVAPHGRACRLRVGYESSRTPDQVAETLLSSFVH